MKAVINTTPLNGVLTDITLDTGEDKGDVIDYAVDKVKELNPVQDTEE